MLSNQEVVDFVTQRLGQGMEPEDICEQLMTRSPLASCWGHHVMMTIMTRLSNDHGMI